MSTVEQDPASKSYLETDRFKGDIPGSIRGDLTKLISALDRGEHLPLDIDLMFMATLDMHVVMHLQGWQDGILPNRLDRRMHGIVLDMVEKNTQRIYARNYEAIHDIGADAAIDLVAASAGQKFKSEVTKRWQPYGYEAWSHFGSAYSFLPAYRELLTAKRPPENPPSALLACLDRLACTAETLTSIRKRLIEGAERQGQVAYLESLGGLLTEYDVLMGLYEEEPSHYEYKGTSWFLPAPINLDIGPGNKTKADIVGIRFPRFGNSIRHLLVDVKTTRKMQQSKQPQAESSQLPIQRITASSVGAIAILGGRKVVGRGELCRQYIQDSAFNYRLEDPNSRLAMGLAVLGQDVLNYWDMAQGWEPVFGIARPLPPPEMLITTQPDAG